MVFSELFYSMSFYSMLSLNITIDGIIITKNILCYILLFINLMPALPSIYSTCSINGFKDDIKCNFNTTINAVLILFNIAS